MGKTFKINDYRRPKKDKHGNKSRKQREYEEEKFKRRSSYAPEPEPEPDLPLIPDESHWNTTDNT